MKLKELKEGSTFRFAIPKKESKVYVVEGQYPLSGITTLFSLERINDKGIEPIAVKNLYEVKDVTPDVFHIEHRIKKIK